MKSRTKADRGDPMGRGSAATTRSTSIARADENWSPGGAAADRGRGASHGVTATTTARTTRATISPANR